MENILKNVERGVVLQGARGRGRVSPVTGVSRGHGGAPHVVARGLARAAQLGRGPGELGPHLLAGAVTRLGVLGPSVRVSSDMLRLLLLLL